MTSATPRNRATTEERVKKGTITATVRAAFQVLQEFHWGLWDEATLRHLQTPTHVVFGTRDRTVRPREAMRLAAVLPHGKLTWIEDGGHVVMEEVPDRVNALMLHDLRD